MNQYLREKAFRSTTFDLAGLDRLHQDLISILSSTNPALPTPIPPDFKWPANYLWFRYIINFDGKGFVLYDYNKLRRHFTDAKRLNKLTLIVDTIEGRANQTGKVINIHINSSQSQCTLTVEDQKEEWMNSTFLQLQERMEGFSNWNWVAHSDAVSMLIQLFGVFAGLLFSLYISQKASIYIKIDSAFAFTFIAALLIFSNIWTFISGSILRLRDRIFPLISFRKQFSSHWLFQNLFAGGLFAIFIYLLSKLSIQLLQYLRNSLIK